MPKVQITLTYLTYPPIEEQNTTSYRPRNPTDITDNILLMQVDQKHMGHVLGLRYPLTPLVVEGDLFLIGSETPTKVTNMGFT
jgi:hypothetical protein